MLTAFASSATEHKVAPPEGAEAPALREAREAPQRWLWTEDLPGEEAITWVHFPRDLRRPTSEDVDQDVVLAVVEAVGQLRPVREKALREALKHEDALVRWSAVRILGHLGGPLRRRMPTSDPDPLVQGRIEAAQ